MEMFRRTFAEINLEHLSHNWFEIQRISQLQNINDRFICPMVKANAYGHGDIHVAKHLESLGAISLGVCLIEEGLLLKRAGVRSEILVFRGFDYQGAQKIVEAQLTPVVSTWEQIHFLENAADDIMSIHLKFNTGMNRLGFAPEDSEKLRTYFLNSKKLKLKAILSHFYCGEDAYLINGHSAQQTQVLLKIYDFFKEFNIFTHLLNSGGILSLAMSNVVHNQQHFLNSQSWGFRPGLILYGYAPANHFQNILLKPVMSLKSVVNNIRKVKKNDFVSYGAHWQAPQDSIVAIVPIGYADGVHRLISNRGHALFNGQMVPIIGRVCMDFLMLDVSQVVKIDEVNQYNEEEVVLFGYDSRGDFLSANIIAEHIQSITWEVLTSVGERVPRHFKGAIE